MRKGSEVGGQDRARLEGDEWKIFEMEKKKLSDRLEGEEIERWSLIPPSSLSRYELENPTDPTYRAYIIQTRTILNYPPFQLIHTYLTICFSRFSLIGLAAPGRGYIIRCAARTARV